MNSLKQTGSVESDLEIWFSGLIHKIKTDKMMLEEGIAPTQLQEMYDTLISGSELEVRQLSREKNTKFFIKFIIDLYFKILNKRSPSFKNLALGFKEPVLSVWVELGDNDNESEKKFYLAEAETNAKIREFGFRIESVIFEESDEAKKPASFISIDGDQD